MKLSKLFVAGALMVAALTQQVSAQTAHVYITGSTAFRAAALVAITQAVGLTGSGTLVAGGGTGNDSQYTNAAPPAGTGPTDTRNTSFIWEGGNIGGTPVTVVATFTGSQSGVATALGSLAIPFITDGSATTSTPSAYLDGQGATPNPTYSGNTHVPDFTFTDVFQATTPFNGSLTLGTPFNTTATFADTTGGGSGNDNQVGFVTFKIVASKNFPLGTNVSGNVSTLSVDQNGLKQLFTTGKLPLSYLTGNTVTDVSKTIFATGRNPDSGTRGAFLTDTGIGNATHVIQYQPTANGSGVVTTHVLYPIETIAGLSTQANGNSGQATGGVLRSFMGFTLPATGLLNEKSTNTAAYYMTYLGTADAATAEGLGGVEVFYKGVQGTNANIYSGAYTFWGIEHILDRGDLSSPQSDVEAAIVSGLQTTPTSGFSNAGISVLDVYSVAHPTRPMGVKRTKDGGIISPIFAF